MRTLLLLRHAKSSWKHLDLADHDRPLNGRGKRDAPRMGRLLITERLMPDVIACSTAVRARKTVELLVEASACAAPVTFTEDLYHADPDMMLPVLQAVPDDAGTAMLVGHNPGMESLLGILAACHEPMPTAALACLEVDIETWREVDLHATARLVDLWRPRDLI